MIRVQLASKDLDTTDFDNIALHTNLLPTLKTFFIRADFDGPSPALTSQLKNKALNICVNMAMASENIVKELISPKYGVLEYVSCTLEIHDNFKISAATENSLWLLGNVSAESAEICQKIVT